LTVGQHSWREPRHAEIIVNARHRRVDYAPDVIRNAYLQDRLVHWNRTIRPHLSRGPVIADRYLYSDAVHLAVHWGGSVEDTIRKYIDSGVVQPDRIIFVDAEPQVAFDRVRQRRARQKSKEWWYENEASVNATYAEYRRLFVEQCFSCLPPVVVLSNGIGGSLEELQAQVMDRVLEPIWGSGQYVLKQ